MIDWYTNISKIGDTLYIRGISNGKEVREKVKYEPTLYVEHMNDYGFTNIEGKSLKPIHFDSMKEAIAFADQHKDSNLKLYGFPSFASQYTLENYSNTLELWDKDKIRVFNIDIEVTSNEGFPEARDAAFPVTAICIHDNIADKFITFGHGKWSKDKSELSAKLLDKVFYIECKDEYDLFSKFMRYWREFTPNIITGWNIETFDIPYLHNRMENLGLEARWLSPWGMCRTRNYRTAQGEQQAIVMTGVDQVDYLDRYKKNKIQESYRLDHIAYVELGERKLDYSEVAGLHQLYYTNFQKFIDYNIQDVNLVKRLDEKMGLIDAQIVIAYTACANYGEVNSPVRTWDALLNKELWSENKIVPYHIHPSQSDGIPGGHVKEPQVGKHGWCMSFDLNSLYPHLLMQFNISPETLNKQYKAFPNLTGEERVNTFLDKKPYDKPSEQCVAGSGYAFDTNTEGFIPRVMRRLYQERKRVKKQMIEKQKRGEDASLENLNQYVIKILLNSGYGALNNAYFRWYDRRLGESVTLSGQYVIQVAERNINAWMNKVLQTEDVDYIIAIDTDSNYLNAQPLIDKFFSNKNKDEIVDILDKIAKEQIQPILEQGFKEAQEYMGCKNQEMVMEREAIASSAFWTAKKRYAMCVWDMEGVRKEEPYMKIQGLEAIRSSTPQVCRPVLMEAITKTLLEDESDVQKFLADYKETYKALPFEDIAFPRTMNNVTSRTRESGDIGFAKGTPPHIKGAIQFNRLIKQNGLDKDWEPVKDGEKGKFIYLRQPNNVGAEVISFNTTVPDEIQFKQYIDYEKMYQKTIIEPMNNILNPLGWSSVKVVTLFDFFE